VKILIKSAKIIDKNSGFHNCIKDILIENGLITKIADTISKTEGCIEIQRDNLHISNGWFDSSVCFGEPGYEERENIENGLMVAAKSGFTAIALNPNTTPYLDNKSAVEFVISKSKFSPVELHPIANLTKNSEGKEMAEMFDMKNTGAIAFGDYNHPIENANLLKIALLYAQNLDGLVLSFPQDTSIISNGFVNESVNTTRLGLKSIPNLSEELRVSRDLFLLEYTGGKLHIPTITTERSVKLIKDAKKKGLDVSCSVTAHHLTLTDKELSSFDSNFKVSPPLRSAKDSRALKKGLHDGTVDMITSDHNPIDIENKKLELENSLYGTVGLESLFGAVNTVLELEQTITCLTDNPRKRFGLALKKIEEGESANLTLFDPKVEYTFTEDKILSKSKNSAFLGKDLKGVAYGIVANNQLVLN